jgi:myo-inositol 2-dehydrogenase/D-chiro-inositol 1-dehydrogenase
MVEKVHMRDPRRLSVGLIGMGGMGTRHALNLHHHVAAARVAAVYDPDMERAREAAVACGAAQVFDDPFGLIQADEVDAVVIASPDPTHADFALESVRCRKPVLCEKPMAASVADAAKIVEAECAMGRRLVSVGFMRRFDPQHVAVRQALEAGQIGRAIVFKGVHRNAMIPPYATGDSILTNSAGHDIDSARWLLAQEVTEVYVRGVRTRAAFSAETLDLLLIQMVLSGDCLATIEVFGAAEYGYEVSAEIVAERGAAITMPPGDAVVRSLQARSVGVPQDWLARFQGAYVAELANWVRAAQAEQPFAGANAWDGYMSLLVADACIRSLHNGTPVAVPALARPGLYAALRDQAMP